MKDSIIVVSGGMDSITLLYDYKDRIALAVSFDYGSNHNAKELPLAEMHCKRLGIPHITIPLMFMKDYSSRRCWRVQRQSPRVIMMRRT